jgi:hypothetical protein
MVEILFMYDIGLNNARSKYYPGWQFFSQRTPEYLQPRYTVRCFSWEEIDEAMNVKPDFVIAKFIKI